MAFSLRERRSLHDSKWVMNRVWRFTAIATTTTTTRAATGAQEGTGAQERGELWWRPGQGEGMVSQCYYMGEQFPKKSGVSPMQDDHRQPVTLWGLRQKLQRG